MREMASCGIFQHKSVSRETGKFWQEVPTNRSYPGFSLILRTFRDLFVKIMKKYND